MAILSDYLLTKDKKSFQIIENILEKGITANYYEKYNNCAKEFTNYDEMLKKKYSLTSLEYLNYDKDLEICKEFLSPVYKIM